MLRNKLRYLFLLAAVGLLSILYNQYYMGILFLTTLLIPFLMFALLCIIYGSLRIEMVSAAHIAGKGEVIPVTIQVENPTVFPVSELKLCLSYKNAYSKQKYKKEFTVSVDQRTRTSVTCTLSSEYAGNLIITLKAVRVYDYLKIFSLKRKLNYEIKAAVLPYYYELMDGDYYNRRTRLVESDYYSPHKSGDDPSEVFAIREYREGDRQQRIHWKLSQKQGQLMIKEFSDPLNCSVLLLVNLCIPDKINDLYYMDALLECTLSLSYTLLLRGQLHYLAWYDVKHGGCRRIRVEREKDLYEAVDGLLQAMPHPDTTDALSGYLAEHVNEQYTDIFYVTGEMNMGSLDLMSVYKAQDKHVLLINTDQEEEDSELSEDLQVKTEELGFHLWPLDVSAIKNDMEQVRLA